MRLPISLMAALALGACGSSGSDEASRGNTGGVTVELPPPTPFKPPEEIVPSEDNGISDESPANIAEETPAKDEDVAEKANAPPLPKEKEKGPPPPEPAPKPKLEADAGDVRLLPARVPLPDVAVARTIERIGFPCGTVVSSNRVDNPGGDAVYKIVCSSGAAYQGTNKSGRLFFREWTGKLTRD